MINNGQTLFSTKGDGDTSAVIDTLYPEISKRGLIPVNGDSISGFVSDPGSTLSTRKGQLFFVNGRLVSSPVIEKGLEEGYHGRIFSGFPAAVLFIEALPSDIDVNIHPGKREIRFLKQDDVRRIISDAVSGAVMTDAGIPEGFVKNIENPAPVSITSNEKEEISEQTSIRDFLGSLRRDPEPAPLLVEEAEEDAYIPLSSGSGTIDTPHVFKPEPVKQPAPFDFDELSFKGYVFNTYIIMQGRNELYVFDQHAAHERVFYEKFMRGYNDSAHSPQPVLTAFTISVSPDVYSMDDEWLIDLRRMGYDIEDFGECSYIVRGIPPYMSAGEAERFAAAFAEGAREAGASNKTVIDKLILRSCKSAVKANDVLSEFEINDLMKKLAACDNPFSCPHGRPTFIKISSYDIERSFRRK